MDTPSTIPEYPALRRDLRLAPAVERGVPCTYVCDPVTHRFCRLGEPARLAAERMDGHRGLEQIAAELSEELQVELPVSALRKLTQQLASLGLLSNGPTAPAKKGLRGSPFFLIVPLVDPDRFLQRLMPLIRLLTSSPVLALNGLLITTGLTLTGWHLWRGRPLYDLGPLAITDLVLMYAVISVALVGHELSHAFAVKRFGGEVHEMGLLFLYLVPALYCNVSYAYLLPRGQRLWVSFAGIYFELGMWGAASGLAFWLGAENLVGRIAILFTAVVGLRSFLFNLNPLIRLDGYYLLVDILQIPNLRQRSFRQLGQVISRFFARRFRRGQAGGESRASRVAVPGSGVMLAYALAASAFLVLIFLVIASRLIDLIRHPALNLSSVLILAIFLFMLFRLLRWLRGFRTTGDNTLEDAPST